jgi:diguanylate cyclase (GGDEF)-like protein
MRIVLVDSNRDTLQLTSQLLEARDHIVHQFADAPSALKFIASNANVDSLITSSDLPSMTGLELCWETRVLSTCRRPIYIILMSPNLGHHKLSEALDSGADDFIGIPLVADELYARLRAAERLAAMQQELVRLATIDSLTGISNRRSFFEKAHDALARYPAAEKVLSAVMFDIDYFKRVNDLHGHAMGDEVICAVASSASSFCEVVGRLGGEEFAVLLGDVSEEQAIDVAERLRREIADLRFHAQGQNLRITCSFGVSEWKKGDTVDDLLIRADQALYEAKKSGRNCVRAAGSEPIDMEAMRHLLVRAKH